MVAPCTEDSEAIIVISDDEDRKEEQMVLAYSTGEPVLHITPAPQYGCDGTHGLGEHGEQSTRRFGRLAQVQRLPVRVGAPSGHRLEERAQSGAVWLTTGEATGPGLGFQDFYPLHEAVPSTSQGAGVADQEVINDVLLDYEEEEEWEDVFSGQLRAVQRGTSRIVAREADKKAVQSDHRVGRDRQVSFAGNLPREAGQCTVARAALPEAVGRCWAAGGGAGAELEAAAVVVNLEGTQRFPKWYHLLSTEPRPTCCRKRRRVAAHSESSDSTRSWL
ncbi:hypothetical protein NDU88_006764 [Pleurodeles waltl]|uniref:Uncharacterized protein n=1 Tax=Pleurodeles waltl TaxID=8319 RepID=A0AAV7ULY5_PLEWA|nr:hypothetical protein NDU88_006764 [Pleurodeles waltl]